MAVSIIKAVEAIAAGIAEEKNLELIDVEFVKEGPDKFLRIYIYKSGGVGIDDCVTVHKELDKKIDDQLEIPGPYIMEVSSPGYDRAFKKAADYHRYMGEEIEIKLYKPVDGIKKYSGVLKSYENGNITVETDKGTLEFNETDTAKVNRIFKI
ncbi:MAG: ribosome maturation factor RimP [Clostridiales bacterium]|nr:ribosome maturation factor RimP [Clostridiales bacterium]